MNGNMTDNRKDSSDIIENDGRRRNTTSSNRRNISNAAITVVRKPVRPTSVNPNNYVHADLPSLEGITLLGCYAVKGVISSDNGEAVTYEALDQNGKRFLVKLYNRKDAIKHEVVQTLKYINSEYLPSIAEYGIYQEQPFTIMPLYSGISLDRFLKQGKTFSPDEIRAVFIPQITEALNTIHKAGILHRDIKPGNILYFEQQKKYMLIDFGVSSYIPDISMLHRTVTGTTQLYQAPETIYNIYTKESDFYSLGITIYELVAGHTPFEEVSHGSGNTSEHDRLSTMLALRAVNKLPFPEKFPPELKILIEGLTYKDISNRDDPSNPNRRWGYTEIRNWIANPDMHTQRTEIVSEADSASEDESINAESDFQNQKDISFQIPFILDCKKISSLTQLCIALLSDWNRGKKLLLRGELEKQFDKNTMIAQKEQCRRASERIEAEETDSIHADAIYFGLVYTLCPGLKTFFWRNLRFDDIFGYGKALLQSGSRTDNAKELIRSASALAVSGALESYIKNSGLFSTDFINSAHAFTEKLIEFICGNPDASSSFIALYIGNLLTGKKVSINEIEKSKGNSDETVSQLHLHLPYTINTRSVEYSESSLASRHNGTHHMNVSFQVKEQIAENLSGFYYTVSTETLGTLEDLTTVENLKSSFDVFFMSAEAYKRSKNIVFDRIINAETEFHICLFTVYEENKRLIIAGHSCHKLKRPISATVYWKIIKIVMGGVHLVLRTESNIPISRLPAMKLVLSSDQLSKSYLSEKTTLVTEISARPVNASRNIAYDTEISIDNMDSDILDNSIFQLLFINENDAKIFTARWDEDFYGKL